VVLTIAVLLLSSLAPTMQRVCAQMRMADADGASHCPHHAQNATSTHDGADDHDGPADHADEHDNASHPCADHPDEPQARWALESSVQGDLSCCDLIGQHTALDATAPRAWVVPTPDASAQPAPALADAVAHSTPVERLASPRAPPRSAPTPLFLQHAALLR